MAYQSCRYLSFSQCLIWSPNSSSQTVSTYDMWVGLSGMEQFTSTYSHLQPHIAPESGRDVLWWELHPLPVYTKKVWADQNRSSVLGLCTFCFHPRWWAPQSLFIGLGRVPFYPMLTVVSRTELNSTKLNILYVASTRRNPVPIELRRTWNWRFSWDKKKSYRFGQPWI